MPVQIMESSIVGGYFEPEPLPTGKTRPLPRLVLKKG